jgi:hypothetical protein
MRATQVITAHAFEVWPSLGERRFVRETWVARIHGP